MAHRRVSGSLAEVIVVVATQIATPPAFARDQEHTLFNKLMSSLYVDWLCIIEV